MNCRSCKSDDINLHKARFKNGSYHIYLTCEDCYARYNVERNREAYELTKNKRWMKGEEITLQRKEYGRRRKALRKQNKELINQLTIF